MEENDWKIEIATKKDIPFILEVFKERCAWFLENHIDQWGDWYYTELYDEDYFSDAMDLYTVYTVRDDIKIIGVFLLKEENKKYWKDRKRAYYIDHFASRVGYPGVGKFMLKFIKTLALENGVDCLRLEAMRSNPRINEYWKHSGFENKGNFDKPYEGVYWEKRLLHDKNK